MKTGVYKITNLVNGKVYIGASKCIEKRWWGHKRCTDSPIHSDLETYGLNNFKFEVLLECPEDMLCQQERDMIRLYNSDDPEKGYNNPKDRPYSLKLSEALKGRSLSEEQKKKHSEKMKGHIGWNKGKPAWNKGIPCSEETKRKLKGKPAWNKGIPRSEETKRKISETSRGRPSSMKGKHLSEETKRRMSEAKYRYWQKKKENI